MLTDPFWSSLSLACLIPESSLKSIFAISPEIIVILGKGNLIADTSLNASAIAFTSCM
jgi:hypothetical protein